VDAVEYSRWRREDDVRWRRRSGEVACLHGLDVGEGKGGGKRGDEREREGGRKGEEREREEENVRG
jgi:hypothetical protein